MISQWLMNESAMVARELKDKKRKINRKEPGQF